MKIKPCIRLLVSAALFSPAFASPAAEPAPAAKVRAALYQAATRSVLEDRHWIIRSDQPGKLVADRIVFWPGSAFEMTATGSPDPSGLVRLAITFKPVSPIHTDCVAHISMYTYSKKGGVAVQKSVSGPYPNNSPENTKEIQDVMQKAEKKMAARHPEYSHQ